MVIPTLIGNQNTNVCAVVLSETSLSRVLITLEIISHKDAFDAAAQRLSHWVRSRSALQVKSEQSSSLKHTTTLFSLCDHYILSREWRVIVDLVQTSYDLS